jgi:hypothetical protein
MLLTVTPGTDVSPRRRQLTAEGGELGLMRMRVAILIWLFTGLTLTQSFAGSRRGSQSNVYGPEVRAFLDLMRQEEVELDFQIKHGEINRRDYLRSKSKIVILRQTVLDMAKQSGGDHVPELYVKAAPEVSQLVEDGLKALKGIKPGEAINQRWRYIGSVIRGEAFYIFERLTP